MMHPQLGHRIHEKLVNKCMTEINKRKLQQLLLKQVKLNTDPFRSKKTKFLKTSQTKKYLMPVPLTIHKIFYLLLD